MRTWNFFIARKIKVDIRGMSYHCIDYSINTINPLEKLSLSLEMIYKHLKTTTDKGIETLCIMMRIKNCLILVAENYLLIINSSMPTSHLQCLLSHSYNTIGYLWEMFVWKYIEIERVFLIVSWFLHIFIIKGQNLKNAMVIFPLLRDNWWLFLI